MHITITEAQILQRLQQHFDERINTYGASYKGVDWGSPERQQLIFRQMCRIFENPATGERAENFTVLDYGCGYGALLPYLQASGWDFAGYTGYDIAPAMIKHARALFADTTTATFTDTETEVTPADYVIGSGLLGAKLDISQKEWEAHVLILLEKLWGLSNKGMAFNSLTMYSDADKMRPDLYYPDPRFLFDYCKTHFSKQVALLHDYGVYEFTILVRRENA